MKRLKNEFLALLQDTIPLAGTTCLDIGCGTGERTGDFAELVGSVHGIDPDSELVASAWLCGTPNATFSVGDAQSLSLGDATFDIVLFQLSFHHVPTELMGKAIDNALSVLRPDGHLVFLEPGEVGSYFEAELHFLASDGDERAQKRAAYEAMMEHPGIVLIAEIPDETLIEFDGRSDFIDNMAPKRNLFDIARFLESRNNVLSAERRISIFRAKD